MWWRSAVSFAALVLVLVPVALASRGDRDPRFAECLSSCLRLHENDEPAKLGNLRLLFWTWPDECKYTCMQKIVTGDAKNGRTIEQYYGKWPFVRLWGMQEPASVAFSLMNLVMYVWCGVSFLRSASRSHFMTVPLTFYTLVGCNAWLWSSVFHAKDTMFTERMDYFSATLLTVVGTYIAVIRVFEVHTLAPKLALLLVFAAVYGAHVGYLGLIHFDYGWNMLVNIAIASVHGLVWLYWCIVARPRHRWRLIASIVLLGAGMGLELLDFPPIWWVFDAHSLWHAWTIPLVPLWYSCWRIDYEDSKRFSGIKDE